MTQPAPDLDPHLGRTRLRMTRQASALAVTLALMCVPVAGLAGADTGMETSALGADLESLLEHARQVNPGFAVQRAETRAAHERIDATGALPDPSFQLELMDATNSMTPGGSNFVPGQVGETRYRVIQAIPGWGKRDLDIDAARSRARQASAVLDASWLELSTELKRAWLRYYANDRELRLNHEALILLQGIEESSLARYRLGLLPQQAVLQAQREITAQRLKLLVVEQQRATAIAALNALLARAADSPLAPPRDPAPLPDIPTLDQLSQQLRDTHPLLAAESRSSETARLDRDRIRLDRYPDFSVGVTNNRPREGTDSWDVMFEVMIPLQQSVRRAREREAEVMLGAAEARREAAEARLQGELGGAHAAFAAGRDSLRLLRTTLLPQAEATRDATRSAFANGRADFDSLLEAERQLIDTRLAILQTELDTRLALAELEQLAGKLP